ncbi:MAG: hypothetical protein FWG87_04960 [Defluviitaleaceae bacterium]|nr:hypothetical protein [Defluviitaleaceae bacterium]
MGCRLIVGDGFIRPEVTSLCVNGRYLPRIDERANLGTDKSVPYKTHAPHLNPCLIYMFWLRAFVVGCRLIVGDGFIRPEITSLCVNGRYTRSELTNVQTSGRINPSPTKNLQIPLIRDLTNDLCNTDLTDLRGLRGFVRGEIRVIRVIRQIRVPSHEKNPYSILYKSYVLCCTYSAIEGFAFFVLKIKILC